MKQMDCTKDQVLCPLSDLAVPGSKAETVSIDGEDRAAMVIRDETGVYCYVNACPHIETPLDFTPGQFLSLDKSHIICSTHGALFKIRDGFCVSGPCAGKSLETIPIFVDENNIVIKKPAK